MRLSFHQLTELTYTVRQAGGAAPLDYVAQALKLTQQHASDLLAQAAEAGVLETSGGQITLTPVGHSLGAAMRERVETTFARAIEAFQPYTLYIPERWWP